MQVSSSSSTNQPRPTPAISVQPIECKAGVRRVLPEAAVRRSAAEEQAPEAWEVECRNDKANSTEP
jgi:hypothetical protein